MGVMSHGIWSLGSLITVIDPDGVENRSFRGFLEPVSLTACSPAFRRPGLEPRERFLLIAHPSEDFFRGTARMVAAEGKKFELLKIKEVYALGSLSHRECVLLELGGGMQS